MLNRKEAVKALHNVCAAAGGVVAWCRSHDIFLQRGNVHNMQAGIINPSQTILEKAGIQRVKLEIFLENGEKLPENLKKYIKQASK